MIFQVPIDLEIPGKKIQAIIDLDTGFIGFSELVGDEVKEYYFNESPLEFRKAFLAKIEILFADKVINNFKISGKNEKMISISKLLTEK